MAHMYIHHISITIHSSYYTSSIHLGRLSAPGPPHQLQLLGFHLNSAAVCIDKAIHGKNDYLAYGLLHFGQLERNICIGLPGQDIQGMTAMTGGTGRTGQVKRDR